MFINVSQNGKILFFKFKYFPMEPLQKCTFSKVIIPRVSHLQVDVKKCPTCVRIFWKRSCARNHSRNILVRGITFAKTFCKKMHRSRRYLCRARPLPILEWGGEDGSAAESVPHERDVFVPARGGGVVSARAVSASGVRCASVTVENEETLETQNTSKTDHV